MRRQGPGRQRRACWRGGPWPGRWAMRGPMALAAGLGAAGAGGSSAAGAAALEALATPRTPLLTKPPRPPFPCKQMILDRPVEEWPQCDALMSWHSDGFPLAKAQAYITVRPVFCVNDIMAQDVLLDRRRVYKILQVRLRGLAGGGGPGVCATCWWRGWGWLWLALGPAWLATCAACSLRCPACLLASPPTHPHPSNPPHPPSPPPLPPPIPRAGELHPSAAAHRGHQGGAGGGAGPAGLPRVGGLGGDGGAQGLQALRGEARLWWAGRALPPPGPAAGSPCPLACQW
jgi:hypothetical protein